MRRQLNANELDELYRHVGRCVWHLQYLEDALHTLLAMKVEIREPRRIPVAEAINLLAKHRRASLGTALGTAEKHNVLPPGLLAELKDLKEERDWLVHRSMHQDGDALYTDEGRSRIFVRLELFMKTSLSLKNRLMLEVEAFCSNFGISSELVDKMAREKVARLKGDA